MEGELTWRQSSLLTSEPCLRGVGFEFSAFRVPRPGIGLLPRLNDQASSTGVRLSRGALMESEPVRYGHSLETSWARQRAGIRVLRSPPWKDCSRRCA